jgi:hypothetical protein
MLQRFVDRGVRDPAQALKRLVRHTPFRFHVTGSETEFGEERHDWPAFVWQPLEAVEEFVGDQLTPELAAAVVEWPREHRRRLAEDLDERVQLARQRQPGTPTTPGSRFGQLDGTWTGRGTRTALSQPAVKQQLLYVGTLLIHDPLADRLRDATNFSELTDTGLRSALDSWLQSLAELAPAIRRGCVEIGVSPTRPALAEEARKWDSVEQHRDALVEILRAAADDIDSSAAPHRAFEAIIDSAWMRARIDDPAAFLRGLAKDTAAKSADDLGRVLTQWNAIAAVDESGFGRRRGGPIQWRDAVYLAALGVQNSTDTLAKAFATNTQLGASHLLATRSSQERLDRLGLPPFTSGRTSKKQAAGAGLLTRFELPGIGDVPMDQVLSIREDESVFAEFRRVLGNILEQVDTAEPEDPEQFGQELDQAFRDQLVPELNRVNSVSKTSVLEKVLIPSGASLGAGALVLAAGASFPLTAAAAVAMSPVAFAAEALRRRYNKGGRQARSLASAYLTLTESARWKK